MPILPNATNTLAVAAASAGASDELIVLIAPCATSPDYTVRRFANASQLYAQHGYCEAVEFASLHNKPVLMAGIPIDTAGAVSRENTSGNTNTCVTTVVAGGDGVLAEHDGILKVTTGGTIGTDQIVLSLSLDGGTSYKTVRLGTASSYTIPYFGATINFAAGALTAGETIHTWHGSGPRGASAGWTLAFTALTQQTSDNRSILMFGDAQSDTEVSAVSTLLDAYASTNKRFRYLRWGVYDRLPLATMANTTHRMTAANVTFAEVGPTGDTIVRASGSWATDGFATGDLLTVTNSASNNIATAAKITVTNSTTITLDTDDLVNEGPVSGVTIVGEASLTFSDSADTITRAGGSPGSWLDDGFRIGDVITITGTSSNNVTTTVTNATALVLSVTALALADEVIGITTPTISAGQTKATWKAAVDAEFAPITDKPLIQLSAGKARTYSRFSNWHLRWSSAWFASKREYEHDLHIPCWRKLDGPVDANLWDTNNTLVEWDDFIDGGMTAARFTSLRTYNKPAGAFIARSLSRALDSSLLVDSHVVAVVNYAREIAQGAVEDLIGRTLKKKSDGTATKESLAELSSYVNGVVQPALLSNRRGEGPKCSSIVWVPADDDPLGIPDAVLNSTMTIDLLGTIVQVNLVTKVG